MARPRAGEVTKADVIREGLKAHPEMGPKDLSEKLNAKVKKEGLPIAEIKPSEISVYRSKAKQEAEAAAHHGASKSPALAGKTAVGKATASTGHSSVADLLQNARTLVDELGKEQAKKVIDLL
jgi:ribosomal protein L4